MIQTQLKLAPSLPSAHVSDNDLIAKLDADFFDACGVLYVDRDLMLPPPDQLREIAEKFGEKLSAARGDQLLRARRLEGGPAITHTLNSFEGFTLGDLDGGAWAYLGVDAQAVAAARADHPGGSLSGARYSAQEAAYAKAAAAAAVARQSDPIDEVITWPIGVQVGERARWSLLITRHHDTSRSVVRLTRAPTGRAVFRKFAPPRPATRRAPNPPDSHEVPRLWRWDHEVPRLWRWVIDIQQGGHVRPRASRRAAIGLTALAGGLVAFTGEKMSSRRGLRLWFPSAASAVVAASWPWADEWVGSDLHRAIVSRVPVEVLADYLSTVGLEGIGAGLLLCHYAEREQEPAKRRAARRRAAAYLYGAAEPVRVAARDVRAAQVADEKLHQIELAKYWIRTQPGGAHGHRRGPMDPEFPKAITSAATRDKIAALRAFGAGAPTPSRPH